MTDYNRNRSNHASDDNWNQNRDRNSRHTDYNQSNYSNSNYNQESDWRNMDRDRQSNYGSTSYGNSAGSYDNTGAYGGGGYGMYPDDYNQASNRNMGGDYNTGLGNYRRQDWGRANVDSGMGYNDYDRNYNDYETDYRNRSGYSEGYGYAGDYNTGYYGTGNMNYNRGRTDWQGRPGQGNRQDSNYRNAARGRNDRDWWDRTKDEVSSWFGDDDAERRRRTDRMNTGGGYRGRGPKDYHRSEDRIREDVCDRLTDDDMLDATNIQVQIEGDNVILSGTVHNREQKRRAEDVAESISGVRDVENRIRVDHNDHYGSNSGKSGQSGTTNEIIRNERKGKNNP